MPQHINETRYPHETCIYLLKKASFFKYYMIYYHIYYMTIPSVKKSVYGPTVDIILVKNEEKNK